MDKQDITYGGYLLVSLKITKQIQFKQTFQGFYTKRTDLSLAYKCPVHLFNKLIVLTKKGFICLSVLFTQRTKGFQSKNVSILFNGICVGNTPFTFTLD